MKWHFLKGTATAVFIAHFQKIYFNFSIFFRNKRRQGGNIWNVFLAHIIKIITLKMINDCKCFNIFFTFLYFPFQIIISDSGTMKYFDGWKMEFMHLLLYLVSVVQQCYININFLFINSHISMISANKFSLSLSLAPSSSR